MFDNKTKLSDLQLLIMKTLWPEQKLSASEVHQRVNLHKQLAPTTVATMLKRLQEKGCVDYQKSGRQFLYFPIVSEHDVKSSMLSSMLHSLFDGKPEQLVHHLVGQEEIDQDELAKIQALLDKDDKQGEQK